jgi:hypothetical protein
MTATKRSRQRHSAVAEEAQGALADDLIWGAAAIGDEIGVKKSKVFYLLEQRHIPAKKIGGLWVGSRRQLRAAFCAEVV